jgi:AcrR family transcriptional regulator
VKAARDIMFSRGFNDITVQDITDAADVGKGTFFNYFRSKEHVVSRVHEYNRRSVDRAVEHVRTARATFPDALTSILMAGLCPTGGEWLTYQTNTMRAIALNSEVRGLVSQVMIKTRQAHETLIALAQGQGTVRRDISAADLAMIQQTYLAGITVVLWLHNQTPTPELVAELTRKLCAVLGPPPSAAAVTTATRTALKANAARPARRSKTGRAKSRASRAAVRKVRRGR